MSLPDGLDQHGFDQYGLDNHSFDNHSFDNHSFDHDGGDIALRHGDVTSTLADTHTAVASGLLGTFWLLVTTVVLLGVGGWLFTLGGSQHDAASGDDPADARRLRWSKRVVEDAPLSRPTGGGSVAAHRHRSRWLSGNR